MDKRTFNTAYVKAEIRFMKASNKFAKEFENANQDKENGKNAASGRQGNIPGGNIPQQPVYGG